MTPQLQKDIIAYKMTSAKAIIEEVKSHIENGFYNTAMNRMYYACFNVATALLITRNIPDVKRHAIVRNLFNLHFVKTGLYKEEWGTFYNTIMNCRTAADYEDFKIYTRKETEDMYPLTCEFVALAETLLNKMGEEERPEAATS